ncbi:MAG: efflux RND transporter periplasmic adaptor subunit, partial [Myxococcales bacterium]|nr:efflux RND transporter periplasmic adaptor subunit [Myxococcales bacterium]
GDALIDIDSRPYRANLLQAQGALERDEHLLAQARMDLERYRNAWARNAIARQTLDDQEKVVLQAMGTVKNDRGTVAYEQVQVDFCHIRAPFAGRVGLRLLDPGNLVQATGNVTLAVVMQLEPITVVFTISQANLDEVRSRLAQDAELAVDAFDQAGQRKLAGGALVTIDNQLDTTTGTVKARAQFENADDALFPNQFVNTRLLVDTHRGVTLVPSTAVQQNGTSSFVYVVDGGVAHMRNVTPVVSEAGTTELRGIDAGALVATSGFDRLRDGGPVVTAVAPAPRDDGDGGP